VIGNWEDSPAIMVIPLLGRREQRYLAESTSIEINVTAEEEEKESGFANRQW